MTVSATIAFKGERRFVRLSLAMTILAVFMPQAGSASQGWEAAEVEEFFGLERTTNGEWVDFFVARIPSAKGDDAEETYAIKRNQVGTGMQPVCLKGPVGSSSGNCTSAVWIRGDHRKNRNVRHRTSLTRYGIKCYSWAYSKDQFITYSAAGDVINQWEKVGQLRAIVPGSFEERIARAYCKHPQ